MGKKTPESDRRRKIEELRKKERANERRKNVLTIVLSLVLGLSLVGLAIFFDRDSTERRATADIGVETEAANCAPLEETKDAKGASDHRPGSITYNPIPPNSGPHSGQTLSAIKKFYSRDDNPAPEPAVHNLEHGLVVAWYDKDLPDDEVKVLEEVARSIPDRFVAVPWMRDSFPDNKHVVLTAWTRTLRCEKVSGDVVDDFWSKYKDSPEAPERGAGT